MKRNDVWREVAKELRLQKQTMPNWPVHIVAQAAQVTAASGHLLSTAIDVKYNGAAQQEKLQSEAIRTIALAIRFLENLEQ